MRDNDYVEFFVTKWFGLNPLSSVRGVVHVVCSDFSVQPFCNGRL